MADSDEPTADKLAPLFEVDIASENRNLAPRTVEELEDWLQRERQFWQWLQDAKNDDAPLDYAINLVLHQARGIEKNLGALRNASNEQRTAFLQTIQTLLTERYTTRRAPTAENPISQYVASLARKDKVVAAHALWTLLGHDPQGTNRPARALRGQILAALYEYDARDIPRSHDEAWSQLHARVSKEHAVLRAEASSLSDAYRKVSGEIHALHEHQRSTFDEQQATRKAEFSKLLDGHAEKMANIEGTFTRNLSLRAAVEYLREKANQHKKTAQTAGIAAGVVGAAFVALAVLVGVLVFKAGSDVPVPQVAIAVLAATLVFWLLRILVRVLLSNLHLETDMRARSTFVHTYLALLAEGGGIKDEDRALVIGLVFRPISDGLVRDDATPPGLWDLVTKNLSGRG